MSEKSCLHCRHNPEATKPYKEMHRVYLDKKMVEKLEAISKDLGFKSRSCLMCKAVQELVKTPVDEIVRILRKERERKQIEKDIKF